MLAMAGMVCAPVAVEFDLDVDEEVDEQQDVELDADDDVHLVLLSIRMPFAGTMWDVLFDFCMCKWWFWNWADRPVVISTVFSLNCDSHHRQWPKQIHHQI